MEEIWKNSAIITKRNVDDNQNPISVQLSELKQIIDVHSCVVLNQLPDEFHGIYIDGYTEVYDIEKVSINNYKVDYANGVIYFHPNNIGKILNVNYYGIGHTLLSASRIYTKYDKNGNVLETLEELLDKAKLYIEAIETLGGAVEVINELEQDITNGTSLHENLLEDISTGSAVRDDLEEKTDIANATINSLVTKTQDGNNTVSQLIEKNAIATEKKQALDESIQSATDTNTTLSNTNQAGTQINLTLQQTIAEASDDIATINATGNKSLIIGASSFTNGEYTWTHSMNNDNLIVSILSTDTNEPIIADYKIIDKNNILIRNSEENPNLKVILSASYYQGNSVIGSTVEEFLGDSIGTDEDKVRLRGVNGEVQNPVTNSDAVFMSDGVTKLTNKISDITDEIDEARGTNQFLGDRLDNIDTSLEDIANYNITSQGGKGDNNFNNSTVLKNIFSNISNYENVIIPKGEFKVNVISSELESIASDNYGLIIVDGKKGLRISGKGRFILDTTNSGKKNWFMCFRNCEDIIIDSLTIIGDTEFNSSKIARSWSANGILFENCRNIKVINSTFENILACISSTGSASSPSLNNKISYDTIISNNIFKNYGQITTYGGGASRFLFTNNVCINPIQSGIKISSNPVINEETLGNSYDVKISNNIFTWEKDFQFPIVDWDMTKQYCPVGIMVECHTRNIDIIGNTVDMRNIQSIISNPIQESMCLNVLNGNSNDGYFYKEINILSNTFLGYLGNNSISLTPFCEKYNVSNNTIEGKISIKTFASISKQFESLTLNSNAIKGITKFAYIDLIVNYKNINILNNVIDSLNTDATYKSIIELNDITCENLNILGNILENGEILSYSTKKIKAKNINISNNIIQKITLFTDVVSNVLNIVGNSIYNTTRPFVLKNDNVNILINISGNGGRCSGIFDIDNGKIRFDGNSLYTNISNPFTFGTNAMLISGTIWGNGTPSINAQYGCYYMDFSLTSNAIYLKTSVSGTSGWNKISTI